MLDSTLKTNLTVLKAKARCIKDKLFFPIESYLWLAHAGLGPAPAHAKRIFVSHYLRKYNLKYFVETGTHTGDMLSFISTSFPNVACASIELSEYYFNLSCKRCGSNHNVNIIKGDSAKCLPLIVDKLEGPALFWLDGHYSGGKTARGD